MPSTVIVPLAQGCEELEAITIIDLLRRANIQVISAGLEDSNEPAMVTASRGTRLIPDTTLKQIDKHNIDMLVLPGGLPGADNLAADQELIRLIQQLDQQGKFIAAICAAPKVFMQAGVLNQRTYTCYPGSVTAQSSSLRSEDRIVRDQHIITSQGPGTAMAFSLYLIELLVGKSVSQRVAEGLLYSNCTT